MSRLEKISEPADTGEAYEVNGMLFTPLEVLRAPELSGIAAKEVRWSAECKDCGEAFGFESDLQDGTEVPVEQMPDGCSDCDRAGHDFQTELDRRMDEYENAQAKPIESTAAVSRPFTERDERIARKNIEVFVAVSRAAGLEGMARLSFTQGRVEEWQERYLTFADLLRLDSSELSDLREWKLSTSVYHSELEDGEHRALGAALVVAHTLNESRRSLEKGGKRDVEAVGHDVGIKVRQARAGMLSGLGMHPLVSSFEPGEDDYPQLLAVAAVLRGAADENHKDALDSLVDLGDRKCASQADGCDLPLTLPIFAADRSVKEIVAGAVDPDDLIKADEVFERCGRSAAVFGTLGQRGVVEAAKSPPTFLVDGLIQNGVATVLAGERGLGKSTLAHELAVAAATPGRPGESPLTWLGCELTDENNGGLVAYLSAEDNRGIFYQRQSRLDPAEAAENIFLRRGKAVDLRGILQELREIPSLRLVIVDPLRAFMDGDENNSGAVDGFFNPLVEFAEERNCAVLLLHHLKRGRRVRGPQQILEMMRGSGVIADRPRFVLGMFRRYHNTIVGVAKSNLIDVADGTEYALARDPETLKHVPVKSPEGPKRNESRSVRATAKETPKQPDGPAAPSPEIILAALAHFSTRSEPVTKTGIKELYERRASFSALDGFTRRAIRRAVDDLIGQGCVVLKGGRLSVAKEDA